MIIAAKKENSGGGGGDEGVAQAIMGKLVSMGGGGSKPCSSSSKTEIEKSLLFREGSQATLEGTFKYINASSVMFDWHPPEA